MIQTTVVGGYPKTLCDQKIRKTLWEVDRRGEEALPMLREALDEVTIAAIRDQEELGVDLISDGCLRWEDEVTYVAQRLYGVEIRGLIRFFDTNVLYRQPSIVGRVAWREPILVDDFRFAKRYASHPVKAIVTGPYTLMRLSQNEAYTDEKELLLDLAEALNRELRALAEAGASKVHVNEPALLRHPQDLRMFQQAMKALFREVAAETTLYFYFGDGQGLYPSLLEIDVDVLGFDCLYGKSLLSFLRDNPYPRGICAGIVDARNTRIEDEEELRRVLDLLEERVSGPIYVSPTANLEYLPLDRCRQKLRRMTDAVGSFQETQA